MKVFKKFKLLIFIFSLFLGLGFWYFEGLKFIDSFVNSESYVLQAATVADDSFGTFSRVTIDQYPQISYSDSATSPFQSRFNSYRNQVDKTRFTHHLCSGNPNNCTGYTQKPSFIRLPFDGSQKLMLFNYYGLFSINDSDNSMKWQSTHVDRFRVNSNNSFSNCNYKVDPLSIIPVKSGNTFYLYSKFKGLNNNTCLQFYDQTAKAPSSSLAAAELYLGYEVTSTGELNRNYNRTGTSYRQIPPLNEGPFGPGPQNAVAYSNSPLADVIGCKQFENPSTNIRCIGAQGVASDTYNYVAASSRTENYNCRNVSYDDTCPKLKCEAYDIVTICKRYDVIGDTIWEYFCANDQTTNDCTWIKTVKYKETCVEWGSSEIKRTYDVLGKPNSTGSLCSPNNHIQTNWVNCVLSKRECDTRTINTPSSFKATLVAPTFSNFANFSFNPQSWNATGVGIPADYPKYSDELSVNNTDNALNYTQDLNNTVFTTNKYMFKVTVSGRTLTIRRHTLNNTSYNVGGTSYINGSSAKTVTLTLKNTANINYSLDYVGDDVLFMAAGSVATDFFRIKGFNSENTFKTVDLYSELQRKLPRATNGDVRAFGIIENSGSSKIYLVTQTQAFWANVVSNIQVTVPDVSYKNFQFNGNVFSKESLTTGFMFPKPTSTKFEGSYITSQTFSSNLKFINDTNTSFGYLPALPLSLVNFSSFNGTNFNKYNLFFENISYTEVVPLSNSQYLTLNPNSPAENNFELINISEGKGIKIDLTNANIAKKFDKYVLVNLDKNNRSRINFYVDCSNSAYSLICSGVRFNFKGALLGQFYISGRLNTAIENTRFIRIHENADVLINLVKDLRSKKYQTVSSTIVNLNYE